MARLDDYRLTLGGKEYVPLMIGGMGVDISTAELALEAARLGGIGHISDAMAPTVADRRFKTTFVKDKLARYQGALDRDAASEIQFDLATVREATFLHVSRTMQAKQGPGAIFVNVMEKLTMNRPKETLQARLEGAMDAGVDGITLSAGLHLGSFELISRHPRFRETQLGIIVSSVRALALFLKRAARVDRLPDFVVVEGPLAGGHLGFGIDDWQQADLKTIVRDVLAFLAEQGHRIPVIAAGGIFTGTDAVAYMELGAAAVQVATRFTIARECGLPTSAKEAYLDSEESDVEVNTQSPTGYPMRMLKRSPAIGSNIKPNCEAYGYLLDSSGHCSYLEAYQATACDPETGAKLPVRERTCLCTHMRAFRVYTCGHYVYRLKETAVRDEAGRWVLPTAEQIFLDYQYTEDHAIARPSLQHAAAV